MIAVPRLPSRRAACLTAALALFTVALPAAVAAQPTEVDEARLAAALGARGLVVPERFKALVGVVDARDGAPPTVRWFDYRGTSDDRDDWWPASSIKLYAAIAALERARALGFTPAAELTYHYPADEEGAPAEPFEMRLRDIVRAAIVASNNHAFNRLVEFVGMDALNRDFFTADNGLGRTVFLRAYSGRIRDPDTGHGVNRFSPPITVTEGSRTRALPAREGRGRYECPDQGNCTTLRELAESMRRVMLHEELPETERFELGERELALLRAVLIAPRRAHGQALVEAIQQGFAQRVEGASSDTSEVVVRVFHKPGYAYRWTSDVMFLQRMDTGERFIVAAAAHSGRRVLDEALRQIGAVLAAGDLRR